MTTCIPIIFQPILYKKNYYVDGGLCGNFPHEINQSKNFLCKIKFLQKYHQNKKEIFLIGERLQVGSCHKQNH